MGGGREGRRRGRRGRRPSERARRARPRPRRQGRRVAAGRPTATDAAPPRGPRRDRRSVIAPLRDRGLPTLSGRGTLGTTSETRRTAVEARPGARTHRPGGAALGSLDAAREPERPGGGGPEAPCAGSAEAVLRHRTRRARRRIDGRRAGDVWGPETSGAPKASGGRRRRRAGDRPVSAGSRPRARQSPRREPVFTFCSDAYNRRRRKRPRSPKYPGIS